MPTGLYDRSRQTHPRTGKLTQELLELGAQVKYRELLSQLHALRRAYPALAARFDTSPTDMSEEASPPNGHALQMFREHKAKRPISPKALRQMRKNAVLARAALAKTRKTGHHKPHPSPAPDGIRMIDRAAKILKARGPMTALALASAMYDDGWRPKSRTDRQRSSAVGVVLKQSINRKEKIVRVADATVKPQTFEAV